jgi:hypothetical protein
MLVSVSLNVQTVLLELTAHTLAQVTQLRVRRHVTPPFAFSFTVIHLFHSEASLCSIKFGYFGQ